jgi:hypothetical protein
LPRELEILEPILHALGYEWSNHYVMQNAPQCCWSLVFSENGKAGPVGMTADEAVKYAVDLAATRIERYQRQSVKAVETLRTMNEEVVKNLMG